MCPSDFIVLTHHLSKLSMFVNREKIAVIETHRGVTKIHFQDEAQNLSVDETPEEILVMPAWSSPPPPEPLPPPPEKKTRRKK